MTTRKQLIGTVGSIGKDAKALLEIARTKAAKTGTQANLSQAEIKSFAALVKRSEEAMAVASERAKQRRLDEIAELEAAIEDIDKSLALNLPADAVKLCKRNKRNLRARLLNRQLKVGLDFSGILTTAQVDEIKGLLVEAKQAVAKKKKAAGFIKNLMQIADLSMSIVAKATPLL